ILTGSNFSGPDGIRAGSNFTVSVLLFSTRAKSGGTMTRSVLTGGIDTATGSEGGSCVRAKAPRRLWKNPPRFPSLSTAPASMVVATTGTLLPEPAWTAGRGDVPGMLTATGPGDSGAFKRGSLAAVLAWGSSPDPVCEE